MIGPRGSRHARVLVVDDDPVNLVLLDRLLATMGLTEVRGEADVAALGDTLASFDPDLVLLDRHLGRIDGFDVVRRLAEDDPLWDSRRVLMITADTHPEVHRQARALGIHDVLYKPFELEELRDRVRRALSHCRVATRAIGMPRSPAQDAEPDYRLLFEALPASFLVLDPQLRIVAASDRYLANTMTHRNDIVGRGVFEVFPDNPDDPHATGVRNLRSSFERVLDQGRPDAMAVQQYEVARPDSTYEVRHWSPLNSPVLDPHGTVRYIVHHVLDVTDLRFEDDGDPDRDGLKAQSEAVAAEINSRAKQLQQANEELLAASTAKAEFLSRMSHELRSPLTAIMGFGELLEGSVAEAEQREWAGVVVWGGRHLLALIDDILDISRIEAGQFSVSLEPVPLLELLTEVDDLTRSLAAGRSISVVSDLGGCRGLYVLADHQRLRQALLNLVTNAIKYNNHGGAVTIAVTEAPGARVRIEVTDTGHGLEAAELERLFIPFERLHPDAATTEGTGLGLALSRDLVRAMHGTLTVASTVGIGSTFTIELPRVEPSLSHEVPDAGELTDVKRYSAPRRVLHVEDLVANVRLVDQILQRRPDITVTAAMFGAAALELAREQRPDLILLDLHLPDLAGEEVLRRLHADEATAGIPVVALTADALHHRREALVGMGAADYLTKPIDTKRLLEVLDRLLDGRSA